MRIFVHTMAGKTTSLAADATDTIAKVKMQVYALEDVAPEQQRLYFAARSLNDGQTLAECGIKEDSTLHLICQRSKMQITVKTIASKSISLTVEPWDTLAKVKSRIEEQEGVPPAKQRLIFAGQQLKDEKTLSEYNVQQGSVMYLVLRLSMGSQVLVQTASGGTIALSVGDGATTPTGGGSGGRMKPKVKAAAKGVRRPPPGQQLQAPEQLAADGFEGAASPEAGAKPESVAAGFQGDMIMQMGTSIIDSIDSGFIDGSKRFDDEAACKESTTLPTAGGWQAPQSTAAQPGTWMQIFVKTGAGDMIELPARPSDTIYKVKARIHGQEGTAPELQTLTYLGKRLEDEQTVSQCGLCEGATLQLATAAPPGPPPPPRRGNTSRIFIKTLKGKTIKVDIEGTDTIDDVKMKIQDKVGLAPDQQRIIFAGAELGDGRKLAEVLRLPGLKGQNSNDMTDHAK